MKFIILLLTTTVLAIPSPWPMQWDLDIVPAWYLQKRTPPKVSGAPTRVTTDGGKDALINPKEPQMPARPDSPFQQGHTKVWVDSKGPASIQTQRKKNMADPRNSHKIERLLNANRKQLETHDADWSAAQSASYGVPRKQSPALHPQKIGGTGQSGYVRAEPPHGGYAELTRIVNGQEEKKRVHGGKRDHYTWVGSRVGEATFKATGSQGSTLDVGVTNANSMLGLATAPPHTGPSSRLGSPTDQGQRRNQRP